MPKAARKVCAEVASTKNPVLELTDKGIADLRCLDAPNIFTLKHVTILNLSFNKLTILPPNISEMTSLEHLNLYQNQIEQIPDSINSLPKLRILNLSLNKLKRLPKDFGDCPSLEILDLSGNELGKGNSLTSTSTIWQLEYLRALYLSDNFIASIPKEISNLKSLRVLCFRDNSLRSLPPELFLMNQLMELDIRGNRLIYLPPESARAISLCLSLSPSASGEKRSMFRYQNNPWRDDIKDVLSKTGLNGLIDHMKSEAYQLRNTQTVL